MPSTTQSCLKQLILTSWKERWSEKEWSVQTRPYLHNTSDVFHVADALVSQAYIGTAPNTLLVRYIWHGINTGLFSYASVMNAISKHEDLHKVDSTRGVYRLLHECLIIVNKKPLVEDSMDLSCSLRMILQWLLRNTEQYLKGVYDVYSPAAEELIKLNCLMLKQLTTSPRTSALLTIYRFEESGVWGHIETDLAVIKTSAGQHALHAEISESCHSVSQLSRCSITPRPVYLRKSSNQVFLPITGYFMLEVNQRKFSDPEGIASQLILMSQIHGIDTKTFLFHCIQTCFLGFIDAVESENALEQDWAAMVFLRLPKVFSFIKSSVKGSNLDAASNTASKVHKEFENDLHNALITLKYMDSLLDAINQLREGVDWLKSVAKVFQDHHLLPDNVNLQDFSQLRKNLQYVSNPCKNPLTLLKAEITLEQVITTFNPVNCLKDLEVYNNFVSMCKVSSLSTLLAAAASSRQLPSFVNKFVQLIDSVKSSSGENSKTAQTRAAVFDLSFLVVCHIVRSFGKENLFGATNKFREELPYIQQWLNTWWTESTSSVNVSSLETDQSRVDTLVQILRGTKGVSINLQRWSDICTNMPQAVLELIALKQKGLFTFADLTRVCCTIKDSYPLSVCLAVITAIARNARTLLEHSDQIELLEILAKKSSSPQLLPLYDERFAYYEKTVGHLLSDLLPSIADKPTRCVMTPGNTAVVILREVLCETADYGWINSERLEMFLHSFKYLGVATFSRELARFVLQVSRLDAIEMAFDVMFTVLRMDLDSFAVYLMKHGIHRHFMADPHTLIAPIGPLLAKVLVASLDIALNNRALKEKSLITDTNVMSPFLYEAPLDKKGDGLTKIRRVLSCSTEHDLSSSSNNSGVPDNDPLVVVLCDFMQNLQSTIALTESGPLPDFVFALVRLSLYSSPLLSRTVQQVIPTAMVRDLSDRLVRDSRELLFAACDLGNKDVRHIAAQALCRSSNTS